ncbi:hypothetical protein [Natronococcus roseus]|uniref:hypothetical protein n=1 Tax=Natronococcus roseus TaxID=1052014 RepID=UPI00374D1420
MSGRIETLYEIITMGNITTIYEISNFLIFFFFGSIVLLNPDNVFGIEGISQAAILQDIPEWVALFAAVGSTKWLLVTKYLQWYEDSEDD